uniref:tRNA wybutosine-synthesizing protein 3 homolog n=1 Tax=Leptobrachium leishanense TaxID=445787 RepID=A0A8C5QZK1_9ANUR
MRRAVTREIRNLKNLVALGLRKQHGGPHELRILLSSGVWMLHCPVWAMASSNCTMETSGDLSSLGDLSLQQHSGAPGDLFSRWKLQVSRRVDLSKKGNVDPDIVETVRFINLRDSYFTTSSCSGRIILLDESPDASTIQKQNCSWLYVTHQLCEAGDVVEALQKATGNAVLKFEPFVLHVQCRTLPDAQLLHSVAINSGFRNSGITMGKKGKIIMAVRSTHCLEVPLSFKGKCLVSNEYIEHVVQTANQKMEENFRRISRFHSSLVHAIQNKDSTNNEEPAASSVYTRRRRRNKENHKSDCLSHEDGCDDPEGYITFYDVQ